MLCFATSASQCVPRESPPRTQDAGRFHRALPPLPGARHPLARPHLLIAPPADAATLQRAQQPPHHPPFLAALLRSRYSATGACELSFSSSFPKATPRNHTGFSCARVGKVFVPETRTHFSFFPLSFLFFPSPSFLSHDSLPLLFFLFFGTAGNVCHHPRLDTYLLSTLHRLDAETLNRYRVRQKTY